MSREVWKEIPGLPDYEASTLGRVRSWRWVSPRRTAPLLLTPDRSHRYLRVYPNQKPKYVHRLVLEAFVGPCPDGMEASHENGICRDNRLSNLMWRTHGANNDLRRSHGTVLRGVRCSWSKLTPAKVQRIRRLYALGKMTQRELGDLYGIERGTIGGIIRREDWKHIA